ncbi:MAG: hypothetical protein LBM98_03555 [Oscillospiraceae bacterium]|nr:hypothetical protein [Oscillospiraceae bacterium]
MRSNPVPGGQHTPYVPTYRRCLRQPWIASPHLMGTYRKCGGGFAMTGRAGLKPAPTSPLTNPISRTLPRGFRALGLPLSVPGTLGSALSCRQSLALAVS